MHNINPPPIITPGRTGSEFLARFMASNFGVEYLEWFAPRSYEASHSKGDATSKAEYLHWVNSVIRAEHPRFGIKITGELFYKDYWGFSIPDHSLFKESFYPTRISVMLVRLNMCKAVESIVHSAITGYSHDGDAPPNEVGIEFSSEKVFRDYLVGKSIDYLETDYKLVKFVVSSGINYSVFFYEDLLADPRNFLTGFLNISGYPVRSDYKLPELKKGSYKLDLRVRIAFELEHLFSESPEIVSLLNRRSRLITEFNVYSKHFSLLPRIPRVAELLDV
jgi:hypothetical protein